MPNIFPSSPDAVGVFDQNFNQQFPNARPLKATIRRNARAMEHPVESGQIITDYRIILPVEIEFPVMVAPQYYADTYQQIRSLFLNSTLLTVITLSDVYQSMIITEIPDEESPDYFNTLIMAMRFKQVQQVSPSSTPSTAYSPADPTQTNTQSNGVQNPSNLTGGITTSTGIQTATETTNQPFIPNTSGAITPTTGPSVQNAISQSLPGYSLNSVANIGGTASVQSAFSGGGGF